MTDGRKYSKYDFAGRLKDRRTACGIKSCEKLAERLFPEKNLDSMRKKVEKWEKGLSEPTVSELYGLCETLDCDPEYLWGTIDEPRRDTRTVMEITKLEQSAVELLVSVTSNIQEANPQFFKPGHIISLILGNPSFYNTVREIIGSIGNQMILEKTKIERSMIKPGLEAEYESGVAELEAIMDNFAKHINEHGYTIVGINELLKMTEFKVNQNLGAVVQDTMTQLHNEMIDVLYRLLDDAKKELLNKEQL